MVKGTASKGYRIEMYYIGVARPEITTDRINDRFKAGDKYVAPEEVAERYTRSMQLLQKYYDLPDSLTITSCYSSERNTNQNSAPFHYTSYYSIALHSIIFLQSKQSLMKSVSNVSN
jgi:predicted ABC-type ATPase